MAFQRRFLVPCQIQGLLGFLLLPPGDFLVLVKTLRETISFAVSIVSDNNLQFFVASFTLKLIECP